jgi:hypothetical protein
MMEEVQTSETLVRTSLHGATTQKTAIFFATYRFQKTNHRQILKKYFTYFGN